MTYIENALYDFIKTIIFRGFRTLKDPRYIPYTIFLGIVVSVSTATAMVSQVPQYVIPQFYKDLLLYIEVSVAISFILVGLILGRANIWIQSFLMVLGSIAFTSVFHYNLIPKYFDIIPSTRQIGLTISAILYITWIGIVAFSIFSLFRDLFDNDIFGTVLFLGKPEDDGRVMFSLIGWLLVFLNGGLGYFIYQNGIEQNLSSLRFSGLIIILFSLIAAIPLLNIQKQNDVFYTILTTFFMFTTVRILLLAFRSLTQTQGSTSFWDTLLSFFIALYTIQNAAAKGIRIGEIDDEEEELSIEEQTMEEIEGIGLTNMITKLLSDRGIILVILGIVIGYNSMQVQTILGSETPFEYFIFTKDADIVLLGYEINIVLSLIIYILAFIIFFIFPPFRNYANPEVKRIPWAPPYEDLKILISGIKSGDVEWKGEVGKLVGGLAWEKLKGKFTGSDESGNKIGSSLSKLIDRAKSKDED